MEKDKVRIRCVQAPWLFVHAVHGLDYVTWVNEEKLAERFERQHAYKYVAVICSITGMEVEAVPLPPPPPPPSLG